MPRHVCPPWVGYLLLNPLRKWLENPVRLLGPFVRPGMTVLEPGCAMGYFTLPLARMVGPEGRVVATDIQAAMLDRLRRRAARANLADRIECRLTGADDLGADDLEGQVDFAAVIHVVHEVPDAGRFLGNLLRALRPGGRALVVEPKGHVAEADFEATREAAHTAGFAVQEFALARRCMALLRP